MKHRADVPAPGADPLYDARPVLELPADHLPALLDAVEAGWFEVIGKDPETRSVRFRLTPLGEEVVGAFRGGKLAVLDPGPNSTKEKS